MSSKRRFKPFRMKAADKLAAERARAARPLGMAAVIDHLAVMADAEKPLAQLELGNEGARPNIMAPSKYVSAIDPKILILHQGIDSIWLNIKGSLREDVAETLAWAKEDAQHADGDRAESPVPPFDGTTPMMLAAGLPYYEWHLHSRDVDLKIRKPSKKSFRPAAVVRLSAECLWRMGGGGRRAVALVADWLRPLFEGDGYTVLLSHVHIATDFQGHVPGASESEEVISRAAPADYDDGDDDGNQLVWYRSRAKRVTGLASGRSTNIRINMYDKRADVRKKHLDWVPDLWERCEGYDPDAPVWRVEFQFGREFLHARKIETVDDFWEKAAGLWAYGMAWFSYRTPGTDSNRSRWAVAPWWAALTSWQTKDAGELPKVKQVRPLARQLVNGGVGYMLSYMAITGIDDPVSAWRTMQEQYIALRGGPAVLDAKLAAKTRQYQGFTLAAG